MIPEPVLEKEWEGWDWEKAEKSYIGTLYERWLTERYGKTGLQKFADWLVTKDGIHASLDVAGIFYDEADLLNAWLYLREKDYGNALLSFVSGVAPIVVDVIAKSGKWAARAGKLTDLVKVGRVSGLEEIGTITVRIKTSRTNLDEVLEWTGKWGKERLGPKPYVELVTGEGVKVKVPVDPDVKLVLEAEDEVRDYTLYSQRVGDGEELVSDERKIVKGEFETKNPQDYLDEALERQGLEKNAKEIKRKMDRWRV